MAVVRMQAKGQMTAPEPIRKAMGIDTGTELACLQTGPDAFECHVLPKLVGLRAFIDAHTTSEPTPTPEEMGRIVEDGIVAEAKKEFGNMKSVAAPAVPYLG